MQSRLFSPGLGEEVLKTLGRYVKLPKQGIIAGQSVASAIDEILGKANPVYNDVDVFLDSWTWDEQWPEDREKAIDRMRDENGRVTKGPNHGLLADNVVYVHDAEVESDGYSRCVSVGHRNLYAISGTRTDGLLNYVKVDWSSNTWEFQKHEPRARAELKISWLTKVFDLNCTQAGVDIETGILYVTPMFEQYFKSRQLQVVTAFTPIHSLLRYLKKRNELGAFGDDNTQLEFARRMVEKSQGDAAVTELRRQIFREGRVGLSSDEIVGARLRMGLENSPLASWQRAGSGMGAQPLSFGRKYYEMYVKHQNVLNRHFMLTRHRKQDLWLLTTKTPVSPEPHDRIYVSPTFAALRFAESRQAPSKLDIAREEGLAELIVAMAEVPGAGNGLRKAFRNLGHEYLDGVEDANLRKRWMDICPKHPELFWCLVALPFRGQVTLMRRLRTEFKKIGIREPWGALSGHPSSWIKGLLTDEAQWADLLAEHKGSLEPLCLALPIPAQVGKVAVQELLSTYALKAEGVRQGHCVGSYSQSVSENRSRIISFALGESSSDRTTAEWRVQVQYSETDTAGKQKPESVRFSLVQHQGFGNSRPREEFLTSEAQVREQLNEWATEHPAEAFKLVAAVEREITPVEKFWRYPADVVLTDDIPF